VTARLDILVVRVSRPLTSFQRLALWTTATTYVLILVGGLVRASGAGLGCPDWPRCFGTWIPPASAAELPAGFDASQFNPTLMWTEYLNRLLGASVGLLIFATLVSAIRHHRRTGRILWPTLAAFLLVGFQGWLGGVVVAQELAAWIVTVHLIVALVIVSLLLYATVYAFFAGRPKPSLSTAGERRSLAWASAALIAFTLAQVALGAQVRGSVDEALDAGTIRAAALATVGRIDLWHRETALVVLVLAGVVGAVVARKHMRDRPLTLAALAVGALVLAQIALGLVMAYIGLTPAAQVAHLTSSSLLLGAETVLLLLVWWHPGSGNSGAPRSVRRSKEDRHASIG
jgi:cytochrome c oxidase assembly protein subunit 15